MNKLLMAAALSVVVATPASAVDFEDMSTKEQMIEVMANALVYIDRCGPLNKGMQKVFIRLTRTLKRDEVMFSYMDAKKDFDRTGKQGWCSVAAIAFD